LEFDIYEVKTGLNREGQDNVSKDAECKLLTFRNYRAPYKFFFY